MRTTFRIVLVIILVLTLPAVSGAAPATSAPELDQPASSILGPLTHVLTALWAAIGYHIDPDGLVDQGDDPEPSNSQDIGCHIDPNGGCRD